MKIVSIKLGWMVTALAMTFAAQASVIYVDMDASGSATTQTDTAGRVWNALYINTNRDNMVDTNNTATAVDFVITDGFQVPATDYSGTSTITDWDNAQTGDGWYLQSTSDSTAAVRFEDLIAGNSYEIVLYGARFDGPSTRNMDVTINGASQTYNSAGGTAGEGLTTFSSVIADSSGNIDIAFAVGASTTYAHLSAISITTIPEPATIGLLGFGAILAMLSRRMRQ